jgi:hypothetical protein
MHGEIQILRSTDNLANWRKRKNENMNTLKERRDDELPFVPKAVVATVVNAAANAAAPNGPQIPTTKHIFSLKREGMHKQRD